MALLTGLTPEGQEVPVQVKPDGRLVAEGLTGPAGPAGPSGPAGPAGPAGPEGPGGAFDEFGDYAVYGSVQFNGATAKPLVYDASSRLLIGTCITFNGDTAAANELDDYEEGTFTPVWNAGGNTFTYSYQSGRYTKIGQVVHVAIAIVGRLTVLGNLNGQVTVQMPFQIAAGEPAVGAHVWAPAVTNATPPAKASAAATPWLSVGMGWANTTYWPSTTTDVGYTLNLTYIASA